VILVYSLPTHCVLEHCDPAVQFGPLPQPALPLRQLRLAQALHSSQQLLQLMAQVEVDNLGAGEVVLLGVFAALPALVLGKGLPEEASVLVAHLEKHVVFFSPHLI
jgi:hypothetical protein